jgi:hypothetical protein
VRKKEREKNNEFSGHCVCLAASSRNWQRDSIQCEITKKKLKGFQIHLFWFTIKVQAIQRHIDNLNVGFLWIFHVIGGFLKF